MRASVCTARFVATELRSSAELIAPLSDARMLLVEILGMHYIKGRYIKTPVYDYLVAWIKLPYQIIYFSFQLNFYTRNNGR